MPFDFPDQPAIGNVTVLANGAVLRWDGAKWISVPPTLPALEYVPISGGTMTGPLYLNANAVQPLGAVPLQQLTNGLRGLGTTVGANPPATPIPGQLWWDTNSGQLYLWYSDVDSSQWVITNNFGGGFVDLAGSTMTGPLILSGDPIDPLGAATKRIVDLKAPILSPGLTGIPTCPTATAGSSNAQIANTSFVANLAALYLPVAGGSITGSLSVAGTVTGGTVNASGNVNAVSVIASSTLQGGYIHSTGNIQADGTFTGGAVQVGSLNISGDSIQHNVYIDGTLGLNFRGVYNSNVWYAFGWDGTALNYAINGGGQGQLYTVGQNDGRYKAIGAYTPNQTVDYNSSPTWWDGHIGGTLYAQNGNATHQFSNISVGGAISTGTFSAGGYCYGADLRCANLGVFYNDTGHRVGFGWNGYLTFYVDGGYQGQFYNSDQVYASYCTRRNAYSLGFDYNTAWYYGANDTSTWFYTLVSYTAASDERIKENIRPTEMNALALLRKIPVEQMDIKADVIGWWESRGEDKTDEERTRIMANAKPKHIPAGVVAQKLKRVIPELVTVIDQRVDKTKPIPGSPVPDADVHLINYHDFYPYLMRAIQQLADQCDVLTTEVTELRAAHAH